MQSRVVPPVPQPRPRRRVTTLSRVVPLVLQPRPPRTRRRACKEACLMLRGLAVHSLVVHIIPLRSLVTHSSLSEVGARCLVKCSPAQPKFSKHWKCPEGPSTRDWPDSTSRCAAPPTPSERCVAVPAFEGLLALPRCAALCVETVMCRVFLNRTHACAGTGRATSGGKAGGRQLGTPACGVAVGRLS